MVERYKRTVENKREKPQRRTICVGWIYPCGSSRERKEKDNAKDPHVSGRQEEKVRNSDNLERGREIQEMRDKNLRRRGEARKQVNH